MTEDYARQLCRNEVISSETYRICAHLAGLDIDAKIEACVTDLQVRILLTYHHH